MTGTTKGTESAADDLTDLDLEAVCGGKEPSNLPEFSKLNRIRTRALDEVSIHLTSL
jgi:hypothetical protein